MNTFLFLQRTAISYELSGMFNALQHDVASGKFNLQWTSMHDFEMNRNQSPQVVKMAGSNSDLNLFFCFFPIRQPSGAKRLHLSEALQSIMETQTTKRTYCAECARLMVVILGRIQWLKSRILGYLHHSQVWKCRLGLVK